MKVYVLIPARISEGFPGRIIKITPGRISEVTFNKIKKKYLYRISERTPRFFLRIGKFLNSSGNLLKVLERFYEAISGVNSDTVPKINYKF